MWTYGRGRVKICPTVGVSQFKLWKTSNEIGNSRTQNETTANDEGPGRNIKLQKKKSSKESCCCCWSDDTCCFGICFTAIDLSFLSSRATSKQHVKKLRWWCFHATRARQNLSQLSSSLCLLLHLLLDCCCNLAAVSLSTYHDIDNSSIQHDHHAANRWWQFGTTWLSSWWRRQFGTSRDC